MKKEFEESGEILEVDLLAALVALWRAAGSASIRFSRPAALAGFDIASGEIVAAFSSEPRFETAAILVRAGKLEPGAIERLSVPPGGDAALAALQAGILTRREWKWAEKIRAIEILADLLGWTEGRYAFDAAAHPAAGQFTVTIPRLVLELFLRSRDRNLVEHQLGPADVPLARAEDFDDLFPTFGLTADAESVVRLIDGRATAAEIQENAPADEFAVAKLLAALTTLGLLRPAPSPEAAPAAPREPPRPAGTAAIEPEPVGGRAGRLEEEPLEPGPAALPPPYPSAGRPRPEEEPASAGPPEAGDRSIEPAAPEPYPEIAGTDLDRGLLAESVDTPAAEEKGESAEELLSSWNASPETSPEALEPEPALPPPLEPVPSARRGPGLLLTALIVLLGAGILAVVLFRSGAFSRSGVSAPQAAATAPPRQAAVRAAAETALPQIIIPPAETASAPASASRRGREEVSPRRPPPVAEVPDRPEPRTTASPAAAGVASGAREEWVRRARRDRARLASDRRTRYAIQLELACEVSSLVEAWKHDHPSGSMWLLPVAHGGRECFRVLWGRYPTIETARAGRSRAPAFFTTATNRPTVVAVR